MNKLISGKTIFASLVILFFLGFSVQGSKKQEEECATLIGLGVLLGCQNYINKDGPQKTPSAECCKAIDDIGMKCTCELVTKDIESIISMDKMVFVAKYCGHPLQPGSKCGSYTVPGS